MKKTKNKNVKNKLSYNLCKFSLYASLFYVLPLHSFAVNSTIELLLRDIILMLNQTVPFLVGLGVLMFLYGVLKYFTSGESADGRSKGRNIMLWGIISVFVMISVWGLIRLLVLSLDWEGAIRDRPAGAEIPQPVGGF